MDIIQISGEKITTWKIDLSKFISPDKYGSVIKLIDSNINYLARLDEETHGVVYQMEVTCIETPNRTDIRFILSNSEKWKGIENISMDDDSIDVVSSYEWRKGKRIVETDKFKDEYNYGGSPYYFYLARETPNRQYRDFGEIKLTGKFLVKIKGCELF